MNTMPRQRINIIAALLVALIPAGVYLWNLSWSTRVHVTEARFTEAELVDQAELVIVGTPLKSTTRTVKEESAGSLVLTDWSFRVEQVLKGTAPASLVVTVPGGTRFGQKTIVEDIRGFSKGTEYLVYLDYVPETKSWMPLSRTQAVFEKSGTQYRSMSDDVQTIDSAKALIQSVETK